MRLNIFMEDMMFNKDSTTTRREFVKRVGAAAGATLFLGQRTLSAHAESSQEVSLSHPLGAGINVLLVHGAFVDASSWSKVIPLLQARGYNALAVQNPLTSFQEDVATTSQALASLSGPTILVGHSYGGSVISNVGGPAKNVLSMVYIAAFAPEEGESVQSINAKFPPPPVSKHLVASYRSGFIWIDPAAFPQNFMQDVETTEARALAVAQKPIASGCFGAPSGAPAWKQVPSWYLVSTNDRTVNPDAERFMARRMGATTREIASSHASPVSHPQEVFDLIVAASQGARH
jgi:pimeloyl-ACP methyl ester carboxylesterase